MQKPTKPYDWNPFVKHGAKVLNEEAGVKTPAEAKQQTKPYYVSINGNLTDVNDPEWVQRAANSPRDTIQAAGAESAKPKIVEGQIGTVKYVGNRSTSNEFSRDPTDYSKAAINRDVMREERLAKKYNKPMSASSAVIREIISDEAKAKIAKQKATKPVQIDFSNNSALQDLEEFHQSRIEADARARRYHEIIKKRDDPGLHKGLAAILGSIPQDFKK
jgi:hypothetical protein